MMPPYAFVTSEFGLDEAGLHRLRSRFPFETIPYAAISQVEVTRGRSVQNWWLLLAFGLACLGVALWVALGYYRFFTDPTAGGRIEVRAVAAPIIPAFVGGAAIWQALQVEDILVVRYGRRRLVLPLTKLQGGTLADLPAYLAQHVPAVWHRAKADAQ